MADPILVNQIISALGLKGEAASKKRAELSGCTFDELTAILSQTEYKKTGNTFGFNFNTNATNNNAPNTIFGTSLKKTDDLINLNTSKNVTIPDYIQEALQPLSKMTSEAKQNVATQEAQDGAIAWSVNAFKEVFDSKVAKSNVKEAIKDTDEDLRLLNKAATGELYDVDFMGNEHPISFEKVFKERRGVEFNQKNIKDCEEKLKVFSQTQTTCDVISKLKGDLAEVSYGHANEAERLRIANNAILSTLSTTGIKSKDDINAALAQISERYKNTPEFQKYGSEFIVTKASPSQQNLYKTDYVIQRKLPSGGYGDLTAEQTKVIAQKLTLDLNKTYANVLGIQYDEGMSNEKLEELTQAKYDENKEAYEKAFEKAYGKKDLKALSERYMQSQQQGVAYVQMGVNILAMAGAMFSGGGTLALASTAMMITNPTGLVEMATNADGMTKEDWKNYGQGVLEQMGWMALGMGAGKIGDMARSFVKVKGLSKVIAKSGQSFDEFVKIASKSPDIPADMAKALKQVNNLANAAGVTTEVATDMATTIML